MRNKNKFILLGAAVFAAALYLLVNNYYRQEDPLGSSEKDLVEANGQMLKAMDRGDKKTAGRIARSILAKPKWRSFIPANAVMGEISASEGDFAASERFYGVATRTSNGVGSMVYAGYANTLKELNKLTEAEVMARKAVEASNERYWQARVILASILVRKDAEKAKGSPEVVELISSALKYAPKGKRVKFKSEFFKPSDIKASILICGPSDALYGAAGHAAIRVQSSECELDAVFSYEGEQISHNIIRFFTGRLKMGMFAISTQEFIDSKREEGRGLWEYPLDLSPIAKKSLWKLIGEHIDAGTDLPYDYVFRGCAQMTLRCLLKAVETEVVITAQLPEKFEMTRREHIMDGLKDFPWKLVLINALTGPKGEKMNSVTDLVMTPKDLIDYLECVSVSGKPILLSTSPIEMFPQILEFSPIGKILSPMVVACGLLILAIIGCFVWRSAIRVFFAVLYVALAIFETYIGVISDLPAAAWNVLLIPFNPLPILFWRWCRFWRWPFGMLVVGWSCWVLLASHIPTDPAFAILALAYVVQLIGFQRRIFFSQIIP